MRERSLLSRRSIKVFGRDNAADRPPVADPTPRRPRTRPPCPPASFWRKLSGSGRWSGIARRRWWRAVAGTDLHRLPHIADDAAQTVVHRLGCPVASGSVHWLSVTGVQDVARRPGCDDRAGDYGTDRKCTRLN